MKKLIIMILSVVLVLGCCGCGKNQPADTQMQSDFVVGYARANVTPEVSVGLRGYGNTINRMSDNLLSYLYLTCLALTDKEGNTALLYGLDSCISDQGVTDAIRNAVTKETGIAGENIMISSTHSHSTPDIIDPVFQSLLLKGAVTAAQEALADQAPATLQIGSVETEGLNFVRHYVQENGNVVGDNFGDKTASPIVGHTSEADRNIQLIRFDREGKDIVLMNFQAHPTWTGGSSSYDISADFIGACREKMEQELDCNFLYFTGAAGNVNASSRISEENAAHSYKEHGYALAQYAMDVMDELTEVSGGQVQVFNKTFTAKYSHGEDGDLLQYCDLVWAANRSGGASAAAKVGREYGINSVYHANAISRRASTTYGEYGDMELTTIALGDIAFVVAPYEMFTQSGMDIKEGSPYEMTFVLTLANAHHGYIATELAFSHGCYEVDTRYFVQGTAEQLVDCYLDMLNEMKAE